MPRVENPSIGPGAAPLLTTTTNLTALQVRTLHSAPVTVIPAPGAGKIIALIAAFGVLDFGTVPFSNVGSGNSALQYATTGDILTTGFATLIGASTDAFSVIPAAAVGPFAILPGDDNKALVTTTATDYTAGPILTTTLGAGGLAYAANDTGTLTDGNGDATYKVLTVGAGGAVLTYQITAAGTGYPVENNSPTAIGGAQPGAGNGAFTVNITAVTPGDGTLKIVTFYQIIPVP